MGVSGVTVAALLTVVCLASAEEFEKMTPRGLITADMFKAQPSGRDFKLPPAVQDINVRRSRRSVEIEYEPWSIMNADPVLRRSSSSISFQDLYSQGYAAVQNQYSEYAGNKTSATSTSTTTTTSTTTESTKPIENQNVNSLDTEGNNETNDSLEKADPMDVSASSTNPQQIFHRQIMNKKETAETDDEDTIPHWQRPDRRDFLVGTQLRRLRSRRKPLRYREHNFFSDATPQKEEESPAIINQEMKAGQVEDVSMEFTSQNVIKDENATLLKIAPESKQTSIEAKFVDLKTDGNSIEEIRLPLSNTEFHNLLNKQRFALEQLSESVLDAGNIDVSRQNNLSNYNRWFDQPAATGIPLTAIPLSNNPQSVEFKNFNAERWKPVKPIFMQTVTAKRQSPTPHKSTELRKQTERPKTLQELHLLSIAQQQETLESDSSPKETTLPRKKFPGQRPLVRRPYRRRQVRRPNQQQALFSPVPPVSPVRPTKTPIQISVELTTESQMIPVKEVISSIKSVETQLLDQSETEIYHPSQKTLPIPSYIPLEYPQNLQSLNDNINTIQSSPLSKPPNLNSFIGDFPYSAYFPGFLNYLQNLKSKPSDSKEKPKISFARPTSYSRPKSYESKSRSNEIRNKHSKRSPAINAHIVHKAPAVHISPTNIPHSMNFVYDPKQKVIISGHSYETISQDAQYAQYVPVSPSNVPTQYVIAPSNYPNNQFPLLYPEAGSHEGQPKPMFAMVPVDHPTMNNPLAPHNHPILHLSYPGVEQVQSEELFNEVNIRDNRLPPGVQLSTFIPQEQYPPGINGHQIQYHGQGYPIAPVFPGQAIPINEIPKNTVASIASTPINPSSFNAGIHSQNPPIQVLQAIPQPNFQGINYSPAHMLPTNGNIAPPIQNIIQTGNNVAANVPLGNNILPNIIYQNLYRQSGVRPLNYGGASFPVYGNAPPLGQLGVAPPQFNIVPPQLTPAQMDSIEGNFLQPPPPHFPPPIVTKDIHMKNIPTQIISGRPIHLQSTFDESSNFGRPNLRNTNPIRLNAIGVSRTPLTDVYPIGKKITRNPIFEEGTASDLPNLSVVNLNAVQDRDVIFVKRNPTNNAQGPQTISRETVEIITAPKDTSMDYFRAPPIRTDLGTQLSNLGYGYNIPSPYRRPTISAASPLLRIVPDREQVRPLLSTRNNPVSISDEMASPKISKTVIVESKPQLIYTTVEDTNGVTKEKFYNNVNDFSESKEAQIQFSPGTKLPPKRTTSDPLFPNNSYLYDSQHETPSHASVNWSFKPQSESNRRSESQLSHDPRQVHSLSRLPYRPNNVRRETQFFSNEEVEEEEDDEEEILEGNNKMSGWTPSAPRRPLNHERKSARGIVSEPDVVIGTNIMGIDGPEDHLFHEVIASTSFGFGR